MNVSENSNTTEKVNVGKSKKTQKKENVLPRYTEKDIIRKFLQSMNGFPLLIEIGKKYKYSESGDILDDVEGLIDMFCTWTRSFPVRKNLKVSKYDFLKHVEVFCSDKDNVEGFDELMATVQH